MSDEETVQARAVRHVAGLSVGRPVEAGLRVKRVWHYVARFGAPPAAESAP